MSNSPCNFSIIRALPCLWSVERNSPTRLLYDCSPIFSISRNWNAHEAIVGHGYLGDDYAIPSNKCIFDNSGRLMVGLASRLMKTSHQLNPNSVEENRRRVVSERTGCALQDPEIWISLHLTIFRGNFSIPRWGRFQPIRRMTLPVSCKILLIPEIFPFPSGFT